MQITIVGAGAIGGLAGGYMHQAGCDVLLADVDETHVRAINERGLRIDGIRGYHVISVPAVTMDELQGPLGAVAVACKSQHTMAAVTAIRRLLADDEFVLSLQNGFNEEVIAGIVGEDRTIGGLPDYGGAVIAPGALEHSSEAPLYLGELDGSVSPRLERLAAAFGTAVPVEITPDIRARIWAKEIYGMQVTLSAVADEPLIAIMARPDYQRLAVLLVHEGLTVAEAAGVEVPAGKYFDPDLYRVQTGSDVQVVCTHIRRTGELLRRCREQAESGSYQYQKESSGIWWDIVRRRRKSEVEWLTGRLVRTAAELGVPVPLAAAVCDMVYQIEEGRRRLTADNFRELLTIADRAGYRLPGDSG